MAPARERSSSGERDQIKETIQADPTVWFSDQTTTYYWWAKPWAGKEKQ